MTKVEKPRPWAAIASRLKEARDVIGEGKLGQKEFAERAGLKHSQYRNWESGAYRISLDGCEALLNTYGLSIDFIVAGNLDALPMNLRNSLSERLRDK